MGGTGACPTYSNYTTGNNYSETLRLVFDGQKTTFDDLLGAYWRYVPDTTMPCDDPAYCPRMFYVDDAQKMAMEAALAKQNISGSLLAILPASEYIFWKAEEYHQNFDSREGQACNNVRKGRGGQSQSWRLV
jgi:peptide methionine sulfoxide reductase MsrA